MTRRRVFGSLLGLVFLVNLSRVIYSPLVEPLMSTYSVGPAAAGLVATLAWFGSALARIPAGLLLTRFSRRRVVQGAGVVLVGGTAMAALAPSIHVLGAAALLMGISTGLYFIAANALLSELYPSRVGRAIGTHYTSSQIAAAIAAPLVGIALVFGDVRVAFAGMFVAAIAVTVAFSRTSGEAELPDAGAADRDLVGAARAEWPLILTGVALFGVTGFAWNGTFNFYVSYLKTTGLTEATARNMLTVVFAAGIPAIWGSGRLADRVPHVPLLLGTIGSFAGVLLALTFADGFAALLVLSVLLGFVIHSFFPVIDAYVLDTLPDENRASAYSVFSGASIFLMSTGSSAVGFVTEAGAPYPVIFRAFAAILVAVVLLVGALYALDRLP